MAGVIRDLMLALWSHIQPHPYPHGVKVAEVMGKLGGRSRQWLLEGLNNEYKSIPEYGLRIILAFSPRTSFLVPLDRCVHFAAAAIKQDGHQRRNAIRLVHICLSTLMKAGLPKSAAMESSLVTAALQDCLAGKDAFDWKDGVGWTTQLGVKTRKQHIAEQQMLTSLLVTTMSSSRFDQSSEEFAFGACRHFALLLASTWGRLPNPPLPPSSKYAAYPVLNGIPATVAALKHLHPEAILDAFAKVVFNFSVLHHLLLSPLLFCFSTGLQAGE
jgi:transformation/transcription domain-associated protein